ncbi:5'-nucleotidase, lipoprotein e(P4) family [Paracoccus denitrificans]|jgi:5'-nucleotidase (lipoprotein e(P4) family)|uniref:5'-nucleotidase, lipoprotein e(P4) family n=1 Tax=Paracoccus denitrificans (strain Pd 1222) TaxID=318586 RepID=A1B5R1_PARDP|nr:5'-nucleotidase, lipoprotein e(P4) family [Paracoccus denitrificans]ABL70855.1 5'-nucleotidase, lipoprotein e(P4) family [Paracoccus denitrificans PD1222]MBB4627655.1 5'-nucleotidase (lipoprotein e(P4) family) [Paracoccus denitrificans]MCU7428993.1 5'-nucleotidase, lipoprotein e(P4) family [Paracoccus denitrificans]QAR26174.1 5'-nucleotidase, lipoprotein e(P4) family [Paracoccus denitrificans]UPV95090.1 5'-nucleotidase, lipoprotein e(P4) family [Paracoccus denitrificans]
MTHDHIARRLLLGLIASALIAPAAVAQDAAQMPQCQVGEFAMGLRYQQQSAEVRALQLQAFALATERLDAAVAKAEDPARLAVVTDLDETVIDNTPLLVRDMQACHQYDTWDTWGFWERDGKPTLIPGAGEFLDHADKAGVAIYYISDRFGENKPSTIATLNELGLPQVSEDHVLLYGTTKVERRGVVSEDHEIVLLLGDTLHDFDGVFHKADTATKREKVDENRAHFGVDWIVLPNATYGEWSEAPLTAWDAELKTE